MNDDLTIVSDLRAHAALCEELLLLVERESQALRQPQSGSAFEFHQQRTRHTIGIIEFRFVGDVKNS